MFLSYFTFIPKTGIETTKTRIIFYCALSTHEGGSSFHNRNLIVCKLTAVLVKRLGVVSRIL